SSTLSVHESSFGFDDHQLHDLVALSCNEIDPGRLLEFDLGALTERDKFCERGQPGVADLLLSGSQGTGSLVSRCDLEFLRLFGNAYPYLTTRITFGVGKGSLRVVVSGKFLKLLLDPSPAFHCELEVLTKF